MFEHRVESNQQFPHTRDEGHLLRLTNRQQRLVKVPDDGVEAASRQRAHVQGSTDLGASAPYGAFAP